MVMMVVLQFVIIGWVDGWEINYAIFVNTVYQDLCKAGVSSFVCKQHVV